MIEYNDYIIKLLPYKLFNIYTKSNVNILSILR